uniref:Uncharacterized protein n=1 Tax=Rhizophora mucronata TaxID=61149 RepID=A0A2P2P3S9_RHIMU
MVFIMAAKDEIADLASSSGSFARWSCHAWSRAWIGGFWTLGGDDIFSFKLLSMGIKFNFNQLLRV